MNSMRAFQNWFYFSGERCLVYLVVIIFFSFGRAGRVCWWRPSCLGCHGDRIRAACPAFPILLQLSQLRYHTIFDIWGSPECTHGTMNYWTTRQDKLFVFLLNLKSNLCSIPVLVEQVTIIIDIINGTHAVIYTLGFWYTSDSQSINLF